MNILITIIILVNSLLLFCYCGSSSNSDFKVKSDFNWQYYPNAKWNTFIKNKFTTTTTEASNNLNEFPKDISLTANADSNVAINGDERYNQDIKTDDKIFAKDKLTKYDLVQNLYKYLIENKYDININKTNNNDNVGDNKYTVTTIPSKPMPTPYDSTIKNIIDKDIKPKIFENFMEKSSYNYDHDDNKISEKNNDYYVDDRFPDRKIIDYTDINNNKEDEENDIKKLTNIEKNSERLYDNVQYDPTSENGYSGGDHDVVNKYIYTSTSKSTSTVDNTKNKDNKNNYKIQNIILTNKDGMTTDYNYGKTTIDEHGLGDVDNNYATTTTEKFKSKVHDNKIKYDKNANKIKNKIYTDQYNIITDGSNVGKTYEHGYDGIKEYDPSSSSGDQNEFNKYTITSTTPKSQKSKVHDSKSKSDKNDKKIKNKYYKDKDFKPKIFNNFMEKSSFNYDDSDDDNNDASDINNDYGTVVNHHGNHKMIDYYNDEDQKISADNVLGFGSLSNVKDNGIGYGFTGRGQNENGEFTYGGGGRFENGGFGYGGGGHIIGSDSVINDENHHLQGRGHIDNIGFGYGSGDHDPNSGYGFGGGGGVNNNGRIGFGGGGHDANGGYGYGGYNGHIFSHHYNNDQPSRLKKKVRLLKKFDKRLISAVSASENLKIGKFCFATLLISYLLSRFLF